MALVIFDLDHTLIDHRDDTYFHIFNKALNYFGVNKISPEEYERLRDVWNSEKVGRAHSIIEDAFKIKGPEFFKIINLNDPKVHADMIEKGLISVFDDVLGPLESMKKKGHKMAIVTNSSRMSTESKIGMIGDHFFDAVVTNEDVNELKPSPKPLLKAIKMMGFDKKDVFFVGDSEVDRIAAQKAGVKFFMIDRENGNGDIETLHGFDRLIDDENKA